MHILLILLFEYMPMMYYIMYYVLQPIGEILLVKSTFCSPNIEKKKIRRKIINYNAAYNDSDRNILRINHNGVKNRAQYIITILYILYTYFIRVNS